MQKTRNEKSKIKKGVADMQNKLMKNLSNQGTTPVLCKRPGLGARTGLRTGEELPPYIKPKGIPFPLIDIDDLPIDIDDFRKEILY